MKFWDASALVPLLVAEPASASVRAEIRLDDDVVVWWGSAVECVSAIARVERTGVDISDALDRLDSIAQAWLEVEPAGQIRRMATRLLRVHPLRAADVLQLAAASVASEGDTRTLPFLTFDERLGRAASIEGHRVVRPGSPPTAS